MTPPGPSSPPARGLERGETVGRFVLLALLGRGGMGEVYAAYDPELDRKVAVKILHARSQDGEARLVREAQAIAKLQHPNVVVVYDVGTFHDTVFIAMEFVDGNTLSYWVHAQPRTWRETLRLYQAAGRGLAAAHEIGMVHRDFKPDNVMLTKDGQVRVMDFGLARQVVDGPGQPLTASQIQSARAEALRAAGFGGEDGDLQATRQLKGPSAENLVGSSGGMLGLKLTRTGAQVGTPAYMAPEQFTPGGATDARTDQFSFCVSLYEALDDERPFEGATMVALTASVLLGEVRAPPDKTRVPGWLRRVLLRGLSTDPAQRYPSMTALLAALDADPAAGRRRLALMLGVVVATAGIAVAANRLGSGARTVCAGGGARFAGVWESGGQRSPRKNAIRAAFLNTGKPFAAQAFVASARLLDEFVARWTSMYQDACEATHVRGDQSPEVLDLRMSCLTDRLGNVRALTDVFASADNGVVINAVSAAGALPALDECANVAALRAVVKPPADPATRKRVDELHDELARMIALRDSGQCAAAETRVAPLVDAVQKTGYQPLLGEALAAAGGLGNFCGAPLVALARLKGGYAAASAGHYDLVAAEAAAAVPAVAVPAGRMDDARDWLEIARAAIERIGGDARLEGQFLGSESAILEANHDFEGQVSIDRRALALTRKTLGADHPFAIIGLASLGNALANAGRYAEALEADRAACAAAARVVGPVHPIFGDASNNACEALNHLGRYDEAIPYCRRALDVWQAAGADATTRSYSLTALGIALLGASRASEALAPLQEALEMRIVGKLGVQFQGETRFALARAMWSRPAERTRGVALARKARADYASDSAAVARIDRWMANPEAR